MTPYIRHSVGVVAALKGQVVALESSNEALPLSAFPFMLSFISLTSCVILPNSDRIILHSLSKIFTIYYAFSKS